MNAATTGTGFPNILDATRVAPQPGAPGRYRANLSTAWDAPVHPSGGAVSALALRAMQIELDHPRQRLRTFSTLFVSTVTSGPVEIAVERLRDGKRMSQLRAEARNPGRPEAGHVTSAAFGESRPGVEFSYSAAPEVGPPESYPLPADPPPGAPVFRARFFENVETRRVRMFHSFETGWEGGRAEAIRWIRYRVAPRLADGRIDPLSLIALADTMPSAVGQYLGPGQSFFHAPSVDLNMHFFADTDQDWVIARTVSHWAGDGYASAEITLWDASRRLLAFATQVMLLRFPDPAELGSR
ncbi:MAG TPA: thioesterase family protein [Myxococcota bacterium]